MIVLRAALLPMPGFSTVTPLFILSDCSRRYHVRYAHIILYSLCEYVSPTELSARISAVDAENGMRRYNVRYAHIIPYLYTQKKRILH